MPCQVLLLFLFQSGVVKIMWSRGSALLYSASLDGLIHLWDGRTAKRERTWSGHTDSILDMALNEYVFDCGTVSVVCMVTVYGCVHIVD